MMKREFKKNDDQKSPGEATERVVAVNRCANRSMPPSGRLVQPQGSRYPCKSVIATIRRSGRGSAGGDGSVPPHAATRSSHENVRIPAS